MSYLTEQIARVAAANYVHLVPAVEGELGYGRDLSCVTDLTPNCDEVDPNSFQGIGEHAFRMLTADRDSIPDAPGRGYNVAKLLNAGMTTRDRRAQEGFIRAEVSQDDRIAELEVDCSIRGREVEVKIHITPENPAVKAFDLILVVAENGTAMIEALR